MVAGSSPAGRTRIKEIKNVIFDDFYSSEQKGEKDGAGLQSELKRRLSASRGRKNFILKLFVTEPCWTD